MAAQAMGLAAEVDDALEAAQTLQRACGAYDRVSMLLACRWRLTGRLEIDPSDLTVLVALGIACLAATLEVEEAPPPTSAEIPAWGNVRTDGRLHGALEHHTPGYASALPLDTPHDETLIARKKNTAVIR